MSYPPISPAEHFALEQAYEACMQLCESEASAHDPTIHALVASSWDKCYEVSQAEYGQEDDGTQIYLDFVEQHVAAMGALLNGTQMGLRVETIEMLVQSACTSVHTFDAGIPSKKRLDG